MSTLVDIPYGGYIKYGVFGVYDTDAKRVFNNVKVEDVYTHQCAREMAIGILKNSNATIAISVTGNAMPDNKNLDKLGEVFIGIAGYNAAYAIICKTYSINACMENDLNEFKEHCRNWYSIINNNSKKYNKRSDTALVSQEIRYYTAMKAYEMCIKFIEENDPLVPPEVLKRKELIKKGEMKIDARFGLGGDGILLTSSSPKVTYVKTRTKDSITGKPYIFKKRKKHLPNYMRSTRGIRGVNYMNEGQYTNKSKQSSRTTSKLGKGKKKNQKRIKATRRRRRKLSRAQ